MSKEAFEVWDKVEEKGAEKIKRYEEAAERLRQLANSDFKNDKVEISVSYDICLSKTDTSLLIVNK